MDKETLLAIGTEYEKTIARNREKIMEGEG